MDRRTPLSEPSTPTPTTPRSTFFLSTSGKALLLSNSNSAKRLETPRKNYVKQVTGRHNDTHLHLAAQRGDAASVRSLLSEINSLMMGTFEFDAEVAHFRSVIFNEVNDLGETALFTAAEKGHLDVLKELLPFATTEALFIKNRSGFNPLHVAASQGHLDCDTSLHRSHNWAYETSLGPIGLACPLARPVSRNWVQLVSQAHLRDLCKLVSQSALRDLKSLTYPKFSVLCAMPLVSQFPLRHPHLPSHPPRIVQVLLDHEPGMIKTFAQSNATPLISAATRGHADVVEELLSRDPTQLEMTRSNGKNALHLAARQGHVNVVKILLQKDPQLARRTDKKGQTALHMAVKGVSCEVVKLILAADAAIVMLPDKFGNTALHVATRKKRTEIVNELLLLPDTIVNTLTRDHKTALDLAEGLPISEEILEIKECLIRYGAVKANDLNQPRDELRKTMSLIKKDVYFQLEQTRRTNRNVSGIANELKKLHRAGINNAANSVTVVAVLFAAVAFAAIFTVPGGDNQKGVAVMVHTLSFQAFFISNAIALFTSLAVVVIQITLVRGELKTERKVVEVINKMMWLASVCTSVSFITASYIVVGRHRHWAAILVTVVGVIVMGGVLGTMTYYVVKYKRSRRVRKKDKKSKAGSNSDESEINPIYAI
ncbi:hypothetical protein Fmac_006280 [Flemingia macrophylla]|uniref:PGG domain-containing protein n=1 Tax=Flemingia macrophylla TaxID=520843 RepID=A0ABD1NA85_9FABA